MTDFTARCSELEDRLQETTLKTIALAEQIAGLEVKILQRKLLSVFIWQVSWGTDV